MSRGEYFRKFSKNSLLTDKKNYIETCTSKMCLISLSEEDYSNEQYKKLINNRIFHVLQNIMLIFKICEYI